ncbi:MAG: PEGA domain-containing protein, partial [Acidobacteriota bacterium]
MLGATWRNGVRSPATGIASALALSLLFSLLIVPAHAQDVSLEEQELLLRLSQQLAEARELFEDPQRQSQSIEFFSQIIDAVEDERRVRDRLSDKFLDLYRQALEFRARASFNAGQLTSAAADFRALILEDPRYRLDEEALSPKIIEFFEEQQKQLVGYLAVSSDPPGARVTVAGTFVGITNFFPVPVLTGVAQVEVTRPGYDSHSEEIVVLPGETKTLDVTLTRNSASLQVITQPANVELLVDGEVVGQTGGSLPAHLRSFMPPGYDPEQLSAPLELPTIPLGKHVFELRRECYQTRRDEFHAEEPKDYSARIYKLEESVGQLQISSHPAGARVYLDGEYKGNTPLNLGRVCSGSHNLEVKHTTGKYVDDIVLMKDEALSLECPIRPSLAFLGVIAQEGVPARDLEDIREKVTAELRELQVMNVIVPDPVELRTLMAGNEPIVFVSRELLSAPPDVSEDQVRDLSEKVAEGLDVEALMVGYVPTQRFTKDVVFSFLAEGSIKPDTYSLNYLEGMPQFVALLSQPTTLFGNWIGLTSVDTRLHDGPIVLQVDSEGPAAGAGVEVGDVVLEIDGAPVQSS